MMHHFVAAQDVARDRKHVTIQVAAKHKHNLGL